MQVWKCTNELSPNVCNWTLIKIRMLDNVLRYRFLQPCMNFDDFNMTIILNKLACFKGIADNIIHQEYLFVFNETSTKAVVVKQPCIEITQNKFEESSLIK